MDVFLSSWYKAEQLASDTRMRAVRNCLQEPLVMEQEYEGKERGEAPSLSEGSRKVVAERQVDKDQDVRRSTMECDRCHAAIESGDEKQHLGQTLCEDCYMDVLSPVKTCDPWAVHSAKSFEKHAESPPALTPIQSEILLILKESGGMEPQALLGKLKPGLTQKELEREFAVLRHMEKARGEKRGDRVVWRLW